jgi:hypothetical protein
MANAHKLGTLVCFGTALAFVGCSSSDDSSSSPVGGSGGLFGGAGAFTSGGGSAGHPSNSSGAGGVGVAGQASGGSSGSVSGGAGGATAGTGGASGASGAAGSAAGGAGGASGAAGSAAGGAGGIGGAAAGAGGGAAGTGGSAGNSGGGAGGAAAGTGGGGAAGTGGIAGAGGAAGSGGAGGSAAGTSGSGGAGGDLGGSGGSGGSSGSSGSGGSAGSTGGSGGSGGACPTPAFIDVFDFTDGSTINSNPDGTAEAATNPGDAKGEWTRSRYGSTANGVAGQDTSANNLAKLSSLTFEPADGNPAPGSMKASAPFTGAVNETLGLVYAIAPYADTADLADVTGRQFTAKVKLVSSSHTDVCVFTATAWSTADSGSQAGTTFNQSSGTPVTLPVGTWVTATFDLDNSADKLRVNQVGLDIKSTCTGTATGTDPTVVEIDHATLGCK